MEGLARTVRAAAALALAALLCLPAQAGDGEGMPRFPLPASGLSLRRPAQANAFFDVVGRRAALLGYEGRSREVWVYPLKVVDSLELGFSLEGYPVEMKGPELLSSIEVRPEATLLTYSHAAFTVREILLAPLEEPGVLALLDIDTVLPMTVSVSFRPCLRPMWPAGSMTPYVDWDQGLQAYILSEESRRLAGVIGAPGARDTALMPYQEEPRDVPLRMLVQVTPEQARQTYLPIAAAASLAGADEAREAYRRLLALAPDLYQGNVDHYRRLAGSTLRLTTPDPEINQAYAWAVVGMDKGLATNPHLGTGLVAGFRTSGQSERPGFAWFFGRDAEWTGLAANAAGNYALTRTALDFLRRHQRQDGKIPHEISQSAALLPWFQDYPYAWASADATPLYVIAQADLFRCTGDEAYLRQVWPSVLAAWRFSAASDRDGNGLVDNTGVGHAWVEGGALYPMHEEIYLQGLWVQASRDLAEMARALGDQDTARRAEQAAERTRAAIEKTYWLPAQGFYAFATQRPRSAPREAEPGPHLRRRRQRLAELASRRLIDEDTVLPAVPMIWGLLDADRAQLQLDHLGAAALATDWGQRLLSAESQLYDPLSYHYGSVWPLFTGWASLAAYRYGRPHIGWQALQANAMLTRQGTLGYVTELLSGDFFAPFGRSSHHQVWSEAMVVAPLVRGLLGLEVAEAGRRLTFAPRLPAGWDEVRLEGVKTAGGSCDLTLRRGPGSTSVVVSGPAGAVVTLAPAFPLDASIAEVRLDGKGLQPAVARQGDVQVVSVSFPAAGSHECLFLGHQGTDVWAPPPRPWPGDRSQGLRILRSRAGASLDLVVEGLAGREYQLEGRGRHPVAVEGTRVQDSPEGWRLWIRFEGEAGRYVRRSLSLPLRS
jgi:glycogen debranching enzyme